MTAGLLPALLRVDIADWAPNTPAVSQPPPTPVPSTLGLAVAQITAGPTGSALPPSVADAVTTATLSYGTDVTTQLAFTVEDPGYAVAASGLFTAPTYGTPGTAGSAVTYDGLALEVRTLELSGTTVEELLVEARSAGISTLSRQVGAEVLRNLSPAHYVQLKAKSAGLTSLVQPDGLGATDRPTITRAAATADTAAESSWDVIVRLAAEVGYVAFEVAGLISFAEPTWLVAHTARHSVAWQGRDTAAGVLGFPDCRRSADDPLNAATIDLTMHPAAAADWLPGHAVDVYGLPQFDGRYLIVGWSWDLDATTAVTVNLATPENPTPQPPQSAADAAAGGGTVLSAGAVTTPPAGSYGGTPLTAEQTGNAATIVSTGLGIAGVGTRGCEIAVMTALQESSLVNLSGGDRDSVGLFQQRPSEGWGTVQQCTDPQYAATSFYTALLKVSGWTSLPLTDAAQAVQRSAYPDAYAKWQPVAEALLAAMSPTPAGGAAGLPAVTGSGAFTDSTTVGLVNHNPSTLTQALAFATQQAREHHTSGPWHDLCASFVGACYGTSYGHSYAVDLPGALSAVNQGHDRNPPVGAVLVWRTSNVAGHAALYLGGGYIASTDILVDNGEIGIVPATDIETKWHATYLGWCQPIFGGSQPEAAPPPAPTPVYGPHP